MVIMAMLMNTRDDGYGYNGDDGDVINSDVMMVMTNDDEGGNYDHDAIGGDSNHNDRTRTMITMP